MGLEPGTAVCPVDGQEAKLAGALARGTGGIVPQAALAHVASATQTTHERAFVDICERTLVARADIRNARAVDVKAVTREFTIKSGGALSFAYGSLMIADVLCAHTAPDPTSGSLWYAGHLAPALHATLYVCTDPRVSGHRLRQVSVAEVGVTA